MSLQDIGNSPQISFHYYLGILGKDKRVASCCLLDNLEFRIFPLLDRLSLKHQELSLPYYLSHGCGRKEADFSRSFVRNWMQQMSLKFELGSLIQLSMPISITLTRHPHIRFSDLSFKLRKLLHYAVIIEQ